MTNSFERAFGGESKQPPLSEEAAAARKRFLERKFLSETIKGSKNARKPLLGAREVMKLGKIHEDELGRLGRRGVIGKMLSMIPDVSKQLAEREKREIVQEIKEEIVSTKKSIEQEIFLLQEFESDPDLVSGHLPPEDVDWAKNVIEEHKRVIAEEKQRLAELEALLHQVEEKR